MSWKWVVQIDSRDIDHHTRQQSSVSKNHADRFLVNVDLDAFAGMDPAEV